VEKRIGFVGCYSHDIILMLAKGLSCIGKSVLIRDWNRQHTLQASIPFPESICTEQSVVEYDGFCFTEREPEEGLDDYEFELVDFGMEVKEDVAGCCSEWILITDMLPHHIRRFAEIKIPQEAVSACIMRDAFEDSCNTDPEAIRFLRLFPNKTEYFLAPDFRDVQNRYVCETLHEYGISKASPEMRSMIFQMVGRFCPDCSEREIRRMVKQCERRSIR
jgi:hypothetical protein